MSDFGVLSDYIKAGCIKRLSSVECDPSSSNQHELNGVTELKDFLGAERREYPAMFLRLEDEIEDIESSRGKVTWYDARETHPSRSEFRFYYQGNPAIRYASAGDPLAVILKTDESVLFVSAPLGSQAALDLLSFFEDQIDSRFQLFDFSDEKNDLSLSQRFLLESIGIELETADDQYLVHIEKKFGSLGFPTTAEFSALARELVGGISSYTSADVALIAFWNTEEAMFRQLEKHHIDLKLGEKFADADDFLTFSQSISQRRSSRAGHALENHIAALFDHNAIKYSWGERTEGNKRPDFIFPGIESYRNIGHPESGLFMLGVKTTCKDRWRQVLSEADRISKKHLMTLQPKISENQTLEMQNAGLQLVVPTELHGTFTSKQRSWLWSIDSFIAAVLNCQA